jgi:hypothetical protein
MLPLPAQPATAKAITHPKTAPTRECLYINAINLSKAIPSGGRAAFRTGAKQPCATQFRRLATMDPCALVGSVVIDQGERSQIQGKTSTTMYEEHMAGSVGFASLCHGRPGAIFGTYENNATQRRIGIVGYGGVQSTIRSGY